MLRISLLVAFLLFIACRKTESVKNVDTLLDAGVELHAVDALNEDTLIAVGGDRFSSGWFFTSYDGGVTWNRFNNVTDKAFYCCKWFSPGKVVAGGYGGKYLQFNVYDTTWTVDQLYFWKTVRAIEHRNGRTWLAGGEGLEKGFVTHDNALGTPQNIQLDTLLNEMRSILFVNEQVMFCAGYGLILRSSDFGQTWQPTSAEGDFFIGLVHADGKIYVAGMNGTVLESDNDGSNWSHVKRGNSPAKLGTLWNAVDGNENGLVIAGEDGKMMRFDFADDKWYKLDANTEDDITGLKIVGAFAFCSTRQGHVLKIELP